MDLESHRVLKSVILYIHILGYMIKSVMKGYEAQKTRDL